jgi:hypothetical protein
VADKVTKVSVLLQTLSRIPGLGFLGGVDSKMRASVDQVDEVGDNYEEIKRNAQDAREAAREVARNDDDDED